MVTLVYEGDFSNSSRGIYASPDNGKTWSQTLSLIPSSEALFSCMLSRQVVLFVFGGQNNTTLRSLDTGQTWSSIQTPDVHCFAVRNDTIFAAGNGIHYSADMGRTWKAWALPENLRFSKIIISGTRWFAISGGEAFYQSLDDGKTWQAFGIGLSFCAHPFVVGSTLWAHSDNSLFRTPLSSFAQGNNPAQVTWQKQVTNIPPRIAVTLSGTWFGAAGGIEVRVINRMRFDVPRPGGFFFSNDSGSTWQPVPYFTNKIVSQVATVRNIVVAISLDTITKEEGTYTSVNSGRTWSKIDGPNNYILRLQSDGKRFFIFSRFEDSGSRGVSESSDGIDWYSIRLPNNIGDVQSMARQETGKEALFVVSSFGAYRYDDNGWKKVFDSSASSILINKDNIYIGTDFAGVFHSRDAGETWRAINHGLDITTPISALSIDNLGYLYAGRSDMYWTPYGIYGYYHCSGMYRTKLSTTTGIGATSETAQPTYRIVPIIANDILHIRLAIASPTQIQMALCNILGYEIPILANTMIAPGNQEYQVPINNLSQGVYYLRYRVGNTFATLPLIIQK